MLADGVFRSGMAWGVTYGVLLPGGGREGVEGGEGRALSQVGGMAISADIAQLTDGGVSVGGGGRG